MVFAAPRRDLKRRVVEVHGTRTAVLASGQTSTHDLWHDLFDKDHMDYDLYNMVYTYVSAREESRRNLPHIVLSSQCVSAIVKGDYDAAMRHVDLRLPWRHRKILAACPIGPYAFGQWIGFIFDYGQRVVSVVDVVDYATTPARQGMIAELYVRRFREFFRAMKQSRNLGPHRGDDELTTYFVPIHKKMVQTETLGPLGTGLSGFRVALIIADILRNMYGEGLIKIEKGPDSVCRWKCTLWNKIYESRPSGLGSDERK